MKTARRRHSVFILLLFMLFSSMTQSEMYQRLERHGKTYEYNSLIRTIMFVGIDSENELETYNRFSVSPRADTIELILLDGYSKKIKVLAVSRDAMTEIRRYTMDGTDRGTYVSHLGYAFTYGNGGKLSCENQSEAISILLGGIPVHEYFVINKEGIERGNALVGGVEVMIPNNDLIEIYPDMTEGSGAFIDVSSVSTFLRYRDLEKAFSNNGRMERAKAYSSAFLKKLKDMIARSPAEVWDQIETDEAFYCTSISRNQYLKIADEITGYSFSEEDYYVLKGTDVSGDSHDEVWLDVDDLETTVLQLFYHEAF